MESHFPCGLLQDLPVQSVLREQESPVPLLKARLSPHSGTCRVPDLRQIFYVSIPPAILRCRAGT